jgi:hypothetical protein
MHKITANFYTLGASLTQIFFVIMTQFGILVFEILKVMCMKRTIFLGVMMMCGPVEVQRCFGESYCLHLSGL